MCTLWTLMTWTLCVTLAVAAVPVSADKVPWNIIWRIGNVISSIISLPSDFELEAVFRVTWRTIWSTTFISVYRAAFCVGGTCYIARCVLFLVASGVDLWHHESCIDCLTLGALSLWALGVDCSAGGALFGRRESVVRLMDITFGIMSSSNVIGCEVVSIILNGLTFFGNRLDCDSSAIRSDALLVVGSRPT